MAEPCKCARCKRVLTDPVSIKRGMGPYCWKASGGGVFEADASDEEWRRREELLLRGGEIDLGANWQYLEIDEFGRAVALPITARISVRWRDGAFEAYAALANKPEFIISRGSDLRAIYRAAVEAGPRFNAMAYAARKRARRAA